MNGRLWTPGGGSPALLTHRPRRQVVTLPDGSRAEVRVDDSGTVTQIETDDRLDAVVRPKTVTIHIRRSHVSR